SKFSVGVWIMCPEFVILCSLLTAEGNKISQNQKNTRDTLFLHLYRKYYSIDFSIVQY
ncbi:MAG: hypothetical protein ACI90V_007118, partial [Bacillariaceae sp.]